MIVNQTQYLYNNNKKFSLLLNTLNTKIFDNSFNFYEIESF